MDITDLVSINLTRGKEVSETGTRPQVLLYLADDSSSATLKDKVIVGFSSDYSKFYEKWNSTTPIVIPQNSALNDYLKLFFENGGVEVKLVSGTIPTDYNTLSLDNVVLAQIGITFDKAEEIAKANVSLDSVYHKIIAVRAETQTDKVESVNGGDGIAVKVSGIKGAEMAICAYLSKMKVYEVGSPVDYDFTTEQGLDEDMLNSVTLGANEGIESVPFNFEVKVGGNHINIGGNTASGEDLTEEYVSIIISQNATNAVLTALSTKISGQVGLSVIRTALSEELDRFVASGFLVTDKVWTRNDLYIPNLADENRSEELVVAKNTPISTGYLIHLFRLSSNGRKAYAYLILPTRKGIRYVKVDGELR